MANEEKKKLYAALSAPFPESAIQRTEGRVTGRGYDTTGYGYQFIVNRLNEVLGIGGYRTQQTIKVKSSTNAKGRIVYDAVCDLTLQLGEWANGQFQPFAEAFSTGGHSSFNEADASKGAYTNGFKKCAAMLGCGKAAYEGTVDENNVPSDEHGASSYDQRPEPPPPNTPPQTRPAQAAAPTPARPVTQSPPETNSNASGSNTRNRLTSKQLAAIWALTRKLNIEQRQFREQVKRRFNVQPEFLDRNAASTIIGELSARASNGGSHPAGEHAPQGAAA